MRRRDETKFPALGSSSRPKGPITYSKNGGWLGGTTWQASQAMGSSLPIENRVIWPESRFSLLRLRVISLWPMATTAERAALPSFISDNYHRLPSGNTACSSILIVSTLSLAGCSWTIPRRRFIVLFLKFVTSFFHRINCYKAYFYAILFAFESVVIIFIGWVRFNSVVFIWLATKWLRTLPLPPNDKVRSHLVAALIASEFLAEGTLCISRYFCFWIYCYHVCRLGSFQFCRVY